jgi:hypothetical protein
MILLIPVSGYESIELTISSLRVTSSFFYRVIYCKSSIWKRRPNFASFRYNFRVYYTNFGVSQLRKSPYNRRFAVYKIHFQHAQFLLYTVLFYTVPVTTPQVWRSYSLDPALLQYNSPFSGCFFNLHIYIKLYIYKNILRYSFESDTHQFCVARVSVLYCTVLYQWLRCKSEGPIFTISHHYFT